MPDHVASLKSRHRFSLNWGYLNAITSGMSAIDLSALALRNLHDARQFAREASSRANTASTSTIPRRLPASCAGTARRSNSSLPISSMPARPR
jgi:hypothetical protein